VLQEKEIHFHDIYFQKAQRVVSKSLFSHICLQHIQFSWWLQTNFYSIHCSSCSAMVCEV